jgi:hypothetical protein
LTLVLHLRTTLFVATNLRAAGIALVSTSDRQQGANTMNRTTNLFVTGLLAAGLMTLATAQAMAARTYGAIAISAQSGVFGRVAGAPSQAEAERLAMAQCTQLGGSDCRVATWTRGKYCGALAVKTFQGGGMSWAASTAPSLEQAKAGAMERCQQEAKASCDDVIADVCSAD